MFDWLAKKVSCFQCDNKVKLKDSTYRRGFRFCSALCVADFLAANPLRPSGGDKASWREQAKLNLGLALKEIAAILMMCKRGAGGTSSLPRDVLADMAPTSGMESLTDAHARYNTFVLNALPFLYGLGMTEECGWLETIDLDELYDLHPSGDQYHQFRVIAALVEPALDIVGKVARSLEPSS